MRTKERLILCAALLSMLSVAECRAQFSALRTNLVCWAATSMNVAVELELNKTTTLSLPVSVCPVGFGTLSWQHLVFKPGVRLWSYENHIGPFFGVSLIFGAYRYGTKEYYSAKPCRFLGAECSYGYSKLLSERWSLEAEAGAGIIHTVYDRRRRGVGIFDDEVVELHHRLLFMPTRLSVSLSYLF